MRIENERPLAIPTTDISSRDSLLVPFNCKSKKTTDTQLDNATAPPASRVDCTPRFTSLNMTKLSINLYNLIEKKFDLYKQ